MKDQIKRTIRQLLIPPVNEQVRRTIARNNIRSLQQISIGAVIVESVILLLFVPHHFHELRDYIVSVSSVGFCDIVSLYMALHLTRVQKSKEKFEGPLRRESRMLVLYFIVMAFWGMAASLRNYAAGGQMLTFFIVEIVFTCFIAIRPLLDAVLIFGCHIVFYLMVFHVNGGAGISAFNYFAMAFLMWVGTVIRYQSVLENVTQRFELERLNRKLERISQTDPLTDIGNRMAIREDFEQLVGNDVAVMMADIDHFKRFNDRTGHDAGDEVLRRVAEQLRQYFPKECCYRYGGDEFLVIMTDITATEYQRRIRRWSLSVEKIRIPGVGMPIRCSAGFVTGHPETPDDLRALIHGADQALYEMKKDHHANHPEADCGRNPDE